MKFLVGPEDTIDVTIEIVSQTDAKGVARPKVLNREGVQEFLESRKEVLTLKEQRLSEIDAAGQAVLLREGIENEVARLQNEVKVNRSIIEESEKILIAPSQKFTATFKRPSWGLQNQVNAESYVESISGKAWDDAANRRAKLKHYLVSWDLQDTVVKKGDGKEDKEQVVPIPVSRAGEVEPYVVDAFLAEYDRKLIITEDEQKN